MVENSSVGDTSDERSRGLRGVLLLGGLGLATYLVALIVTLPARIVVETFGARLDASSIAGTIWEGELGLRGGHSLAWTLHPLDSLLHLGASVSWQLEGRGTSVSGKSYAWPQNLRASDVQGVIAWPAVRALVPALRFDCDLAARLDLQDLQLGRGTQSVTGEMRSGAGTCKDLGQPDAPSLQIPALQASAGRSAADIVLAEVADPTRLWAELTLLPDRRLSVTLTERAIATTARSHMAGPVSVEFGF